MFAAGHSTRFDWRESVDECIDAVARPGGDAAGFTLGFVYASDSFAHSMQAITGRLREATGAPDWVGTVGLGVCNGFEEVYERPALSVLLTDINPERYRLLADAGPKLKRDARLRAWCGDNLATIGILHGDPNNPSLADLIKTLAAAVTEGFMIGGLTSSRSDNTQVAGDTLSEGGLSGALLSNEVALATAVTQGCAPISRPRKITECWRNIIVTLDNRPALSAMKEDVGEEIFRRPQGIGRAIFAGFPVAGSDTGDYIVRQLMGVDERNNLLAVGEMVEEGQAVMFCRRDEESAVKDMTRMLADIKKRIGENQPQGALYYSCLGRGRSLFGPDSRELRLIRDALGDIPLTGFFGNGEIAHNRVYGFTGVLTVFL